MALALSIHIGDRIQIGEREFSVQAIQENGDYVLVSGEEAFHIVEERYTEVMPDVLITVGFYQGDGVAKLTIDAPRKIKIRRLKNEP